MIHNLTDLCLPAFPLERHFISLYISNSSPSMSIFGYALVHWCVNQTIAGLPTTLQISQYIVANVNKPKPPASSSSSGLRDINLPLLSSPHTVFLFCRVWPRTFPPGQITSKLPMTGRTTGYPLVSNSPNRSRKLQGDRNAISISSCCSRFVQAQACLRVQQNSCDLMRMP